ncbi:predicted protein [Bathycoccus prasinos]|uniref:Phosphoribosyltransferase domain-containing protein n=1 Tax=Bathycoccus prasinos TaxID=41875 RepID=K8EAB7_9CHLO|nr:predicted protein [Bathycoccus prasinos]CCO14772.1 predicted protein [Bathycoccus prasinos]|eukprot:XP_007514532.1 predicted protein [Bathycoccus prasinos]
MLRNGGGAIGGGKGASSVVVVVAFMLFLKLAYTTHSSGGEIQNEVTQKREKIFEFFAQEISLVRRVVVVVVGCCCCCCCECAVLLSLVGCSGRGEDLDRRAVRHTTRESTRVYIKKRARFIFSRVGERNHQKMTHQQQQRMSSQAERGTMKKIVFYCPEMEKMAREVRANDPDAVELGTIKWRRFPDGYPNIFIDNADDIRGRHVAFLASFHDAATIFEQISVVYSLPKMFVASFTLILPFFPTGTFERVDKEGEVPTAVTLARMLSNIPSSRGGPTSTIIFDIHALQERFYFGDGVSPLFESGIPLLLEQLAELKRGDAGKEEIAIAYPDEGACKRFHGFFEDEFTEVVCTKVREGDKRIVTLKEGNPLNKHVVIVDDLVQSGGTLIECMRLLKAKGATKVSAYVTHGVFPNSSWKKFTEPSDASERFEHFFITDSCPLTVDAVNGQSPFRVMSLAGSIARALRI